MNTTGIPLKDPEVSAAAGDMEQLERAYIDASTRVPVLLFYTSAIAWLIVGTILAMTVSFGLHWPDLFGGISFLTWGRLRPAHMNMMVYGWASMAGMGTAVWLMARLCRTTLRFPLLLAAGGAFWNLGVLIGVGAILLGDSTGFQWLEFPRYVAVILFVAYTLMASWAVLMFRHRRGDQIYITQWFLLGAFLWFPWLYAAGQLMLFVVPVQGVLQSAITWWYANNLLDVCAFFKLDRNDANGGRSVPGVDDHGEHRRDDLDDDSCGNYRVESSSDHAGIFPVDALQPDAALHGLRRHVLHGL